MRFQLIAASLIASLCTVAFAQQGGGSDVITVRSDPAAVRQFVSSVAQAPQSAGLLARWNQEFCPGVAGATPDVAQAIIDRMARRANAVGLHPGAPGCHANVMIIVSNDSDRVAHDIDQRRHASLIAPNGIDAKTLGEQALTDFVNTPRPIRWWHVAQVVTADGQVLGDDQASSSGDARSTFEMSQEASMGGGPGSGDAISGVRQTRSDGTRLRSATRQDLNYVLVIVDTRRLGGASVGAVADYVAFVSLAQINPAPVTTTFPTILNLFNDENAANRPTGLTQWDLAYLDGLYHATRTARNSRQQEDEIARRMMGAPS